MARNLWNAAPRWNARYETFCIGVVAGMRHSDAYYAAGFGGLKGRQTDGPGRLLRRDDIRNRIKQLQAIQALRLNVTIDSLILELETARKIAERDINPAAMVAATMSKAKLLGFLTEKPLEGGKTPKPCPIPTDLVEMDEKTWLEMFRPKTLVR